MRDGSWFDSQPRVSAFCTTFQSSIARNWKRRVQNWQRRFEQLVANNEYSSPTQISETQDEQPLLNETMNSEISRPSFRLIPISAAMLVSPRAIISAYWQWVPL